MSKLTNSELADIRVRNETVRYARHLGVKDRGIDLITSIEDGLRQWYELGGRVCTGLEEGFKEFESLHPGVMAKIQKHRVSITYPKGKPGKRRLDKITRALRFRAEGKDWKEIIVILHGEKQCRALGPKGRKNLIRHYQIVIASRKKREKEKKQKMMAFAN